MSHHVHTFSLGPSLDSREPSRHLSGTLSYREDPSFVVDKQELHNYLTCPALRRRNASAGDAHYRVRASKEPPIMRFGPPSPGTRSRRTRSPRRGDAIGHGRQDCSGPRTGSRAIQRGRGACAQRTAMVHRVPVSDPKAHSRQGTEGEPRAHPGPTSRRRLAGFET
jgi:hypothetical protein